MTQRKLTGSSKTLRALLSVTSLLLISTVAQAITLYQYVGNNFTTIIDSNPPAGSYDTSMHLSIWFTVDALPVASSSFGSESILNFSFNDGRTTLTDSDVDIQSGGFELGATGEVINWWLDVYVGNWPYFSNLAHVGDQGFALHSYNWDGITEDLGAIVVCTAWYLSCQTDSRDGAYNQYAPGVWTYSVIPVPAATWLFGGALSLLAWLCRRGTP